MGGGTAMARVTEAASAAATAKEGERRYGKTRGQWCHGCRFSVICCHACIPHMRRTGVPWVREHSTQIASTATATDYRPVCLGRVQPERQIHALQLTALGLDLTSTIVCGCGCDCNCVCVSAGIAVCIVVAIVTLPGTPWLNLHCGLVPGIVACLPAYRGSGCDQAWTHKWRCPGPCRRSRGSRRGVPLSWARGHCAGIAWCRAGRSGGSDEARA